MSVTWTSCVLRITWCLSLLLLAPGHTEEADPKDLKLLVRGNTRFALDLYAQLKDAPGNLVFSPFSISTALTLMHAGAKGETAAQMRKVLGFPWEGERLHAAMSELIAKTLVREGVGLQGEPGDKMGELKPGRNQSLQMANTFWGRKGLTFQKDFMDQIARKYQAALREVDFQNSLELACKSINEEIERSTSGKIKGAITPEILDKRTCFLITNALYLHAAWEMPFIKEHTKTLDFHLNPKEKVSVPMMQRSLHLLYMENAEAMGLVMQYLNSCRMVVILPKEDVAWDNFEKSLTIEKLRSWLESFKPRQVSVTLPSFKIGTGLSISDKLKALGIKDAFSLPPADFSGMEATRSLFIGEVRHQTYIQIDEEGTEAAAATEVWGTKDGDPPATFCADRPFLFLIVDNKTDSILFMGRVTDPSK